MKKSLSFLSLPIMAILFFCGCTKDNKEVVNNPPTPPPPSANILPTANGGPNHFIYVPGDSLSINARQSTDVDGTIVSYSLTQISGPALSTIENHPSMMGIHLVRKLVAGSYDFELKVTDNKGASATDNIRVEVIQGPPSGTEYDLDSMVWELPWYEEDIHVLRTPERPDIFPNNLSAGDFVQFPADIYLRFDTAILWSKLPPHDADDYVDNMALYINGTMAFVYQVGQRKLEGRKASLRVKFH